MIHIKQNHRLLLRRDRVPRQSNTAPRAGSRYWRYQASRVKKLRHSPAVTERMAARKGVTV